MSRTTTNNVFDVSPFLLVEATADSEAAGYDDDECADDLYDIDESSTSCETSCCVTWTKHRRPTWLSRPDHPVKEESDVGEEEDEDGEGEEEVNSYRRSCGRSGQQRENPAVDLGTVVSETDQSRMFWEACLAS